MLLAEFKIKYGEDADLSIGTASLSGAITGHTLTNVKMATDQQSSASGETTFIPSGEWSIIPTEAVISSGSGDVTANYDITYKAGKLTVEKVDPVIKEAPVVIKRTEFVIGVENEIITAGKAEGGQFLYALYRYVDKGEVIATDDKDSTTSDEGNTDADDGETDDNDGDDEETGDNDGDDGETGDNDGDDGEIGDNDGDDGETDDDDGDDGETGDNDGDDGETDDDDGDDGDTGDNDGDDGKTGDDNNNGEEVDDDDITDSSKTLIMVKDYSDSLPTVDEIGKYKVFYYVKGDENHNDSTVFKADVIVLLNDPMLSAPTIFENTTELHLVKGQKFTLNETGWTVQKNKYLCFCGGSASDDRQERGRD